MYRIEGLAGMITGSNIIVIDKTSGIEYDFEFPGLIDKINIVSESASNRFKLETTTFNGDVKPFDINDFNKDSNLLIMVSTGNLDRCYKKFNSMAKPPLLIVLTGMDMDKIQYEIVSSGRIFDTNIKYINDMKTTDVNSSAYKIKCISKRFRNGMYFKSDVEDIKNIWNNDKDAIKDALVVAGMNYIKTLITKDEKLKKLLIGDSNSDNS